MSTKRYFTSSTFPATKSIIKITAPRIANRLNRWTHCSRRIKCIVIISVIISYVVSFQHSTKYISTATNNIHNKTHISIFHKKAEPFKSIKYQVQVQAQSRTLKSNDIYLKEFSGDYEELPPISTMNNINHKYTIEEIYFSLTTSTKRILTTIHFLKFWAKHHSINCLLVFEEKDFTNNKNITKFLLSQGIRCKIRASKVTIYVKRFGEELLRLAWNNQRTKDTNTRTKEIQWFAVGDDDTVWFINNLLHTLQQYNSSSSIYLGDISDNKRQIRYCGDFFAYGGGGILLSRPLAFLFAQHAKECEGFSRKLGGDARIGKCIVKVLNGTLTKNNHFHQMDHVGRIFGYLEGGIEGLVTLHHMFRWWKPFPDGYSGGMNETMYLLELAYKTFNKRFLKRYVRMNHETNQTLLLTLGFSFSLFNRILSYAELNQIERTWCCNEMVARKTRLKEKNKMTWYFRDVTSELLDGSIRYRITYENKTMYNQILNIGVTLNN